ncbi:MAG: class I SAM-dependent methyltransferase, partial [Candidatus Micrarchaeaceae archaeon]
NHLFSMMADIGWRRDAARETVMPKRSYAVLDVATGTGDLAIAISRAASSKGKTANIIGADFNTYMLSHAKAKAARMGIKNIKFEEGDALRTGYPDSTFDVVTSGFALRNFDSLDRFAAEASRVTKRGGRIVMLDMAKPDMAPQFMKAYFKVLEAVGSLVAKNAYRWLTYSIMRFDKEKAAETFRKHGFTGVRITNLRYGVAFMITGTKR